MVASPVVVMNVVGARPNFMKIAPLIRAMSARPAEIRPLLVHTGQHYDRQMSDSFFEVLGIPLPDIDLEVGSGTHAAQTARIMQAFEPVLLAECPDYLVVVGDVNSTIACTLVAAKIAYAQANRHGRTRPRIVHVEAGLRSRDWEMPEEINRVLTDRLSDLLFTTEAGAAANLRAEGLPPERIHFVGNVMIDTLLAQLPAARQLAVCGRYGQEPGGYAVLTMHRPSNVDDPAVLADRIELLRQVQDRIPVVFPVHPRTAERLRQYGLREDLAALPRVVAGEPLDYRQFLSLALDARFVMTDSGGIQEEATVLGIPCLTMRENTERPITIEQGTNQLVGTDTDRILRAVDAILAGARPMGRPPPLWDGRAAERIVEQILADHREGISRQPGQAS